MWQFLLMVFIPLAYSDTHVDVFSSITELTKVARKEAAFYDDLRKLATQWENNAKVINLFLEENPIPPQSDSEQYVSHPINAINLVKRLSLDFKRSAVVDILKQNSTTVLQEKLKNISTTFPTLQDFRGGCNGIHLLQEHYQLDIETLVNGTININNKTFFSEHKLGPEELTTIGIHAANDGYFDTAMKWLELAQTIFEYQRKEGVKYLEDLQEIDKRIHELKQIHDHVLEKRGQIGQTHRCNNLPYDKNLRKKKKYRNAGGKKIESNSSSYQPLYTENEGTVQESQLRHNFERICQGEQLRSPAMDAVLKCRLLHHDNPYLKLGPFKIEEKSMEPYIVLFHQLMSDLEMEHFRKYASDKLERSGHGGKKGHGMTSLKRTSKQTWLEHRNFTLDMDFLKLKMGVNSDFEVFQTLNDDYGWESFACTRSNKNPIDKVADKVSDRMELATRFELYKQYSAESFQVANYGLGGQYTQHLDAHGYWNGRETPLLHERTGDRIATIMVYLTDVEAGGGTSFPNTGVRIEAKKGNAAFWYNLHPNGLQDKLTHHGGCPVLVGSKWITNKWVGYKDQFRNWRCDANNPSARYSKFRGYY